MSTYLGSAVEVFGGLNGAGQGAGVHTQVMHVYPLLLKELRQPLATVGESIYVTFVRAKSVCMCVGGMTRKASHVFTFVLWQGLRRMARVLPLQSRNPFRSIRRLL